MDLLLCKPALGPITFPGGLFRSRPSRLKFTLTRALVTISTIALVMLHSDNHAATPTTLARSRNGSVLIGDSLG